jgi:hypothetical protein
MQLSREQINAPLLDDRPRLRRDLAIHLMEVRPALFDIHPAPYLMALVDDSIELALGFGITDVQALRVFLQLRWDVAAGYFLQPEIATALRQHGRDGMACWERLAQEDYGDAWLAAHAFDEPHHWRERLWGAVQ